MFVDAALTEKERELHEEIERSFFKPWTPAKLGVL